MAVERHSVESLEVMKKELAKLIEKTEEIRKKVKAASLDAVAIDGERDRLKGLKKIADWLIDANIAVESAKIRQSASS